MHRIMFALCLIGGILGAGGAVADQGTVVQLAPETRAHLAGLPVIAGTPLSRDALANKVVVISFFASWCPPCHVEFKHLNDLSAAYRDDDVVIIAINRFEHVGRFHDDGTRLKRFLARYDPAFTVVEGDQAIAARMGDVARIPTVLVFGRDGRPFLHFIHAKGARKMNPSAEEVDRAVRAALG